MNETGGNTEEILDGILGKAIHPVFGDCFPEAVLEEINDVGIDQESVGLNEFYDCVNPL